MHANFREKKVKDLKKEEVSEEVLPRVLRIVNRRSMIRRVLYRKRSHGSSLRCERNMRAKLGEMRRGEAR